MSDQRSRAGAALVIALLLLGLSMTWIRPTQADQYTDQITQKQQQQGQFSGLIGQLRQEIQGSQVREAQLQGMIVALDGQIVDTQRHIADGQVLLQQISDHLVLEEQHLDQVRAQLGLDKRTLAEELVLIYKMGTNTPVNNLLASDNFNDFWRRLIDLRRVSGTQQNVLDRVHREEHEVTIAVADITAQKQRQQHLLDDLQRQQLQLQDQRSQRQTLVDQLAALVALDQKRMADAEQAIRVLTTEIASLQQEEARLHAGSGHFVWPEQGPISQYFGCTTYPSEPYAPQCRSRHFHTGIDIADDAGTHIHAGDAGLAHIYYSSFGYGNHVIILHGNGWVSVYGHMSSFVIGDGQMVGRGQLIGFEGSTGNSSGPHLHFEVRLNDTPVDPLRYLP
jgi:murein DD-endopeptidase MepM/ murein hydrolase activator NlpD